MQIATKLRRYVDSEGNPVIRVEPKHSRYDLFEIKQTESEVEARMRSAETDAIETFDFEFSNESLRGINCPNMTARRRIDQDLIDVLQTLGFAVIDPNVRRW